jgi:hypothetical protein
MGGYMPAGSRRGFVKAAAGTALCTALGAPYIRRSIAAEPSIVGQWSPVFGWPCVAIHNHVLRDGKILTWADDDAAFPDRLANFSKAFVVSVPADDMPPTTVTEVDNQVTNLFCSGHTFLADGRLLVVGGHEGQQYYGSTDVTIFDPATYTWQTQFAYPMTGGRWYGTAVTLGNGEVLVLSGTMTSQNDINPLPQIWRTNDGGGWRNLTKAKLKVPIYPNLFVAPDGRVYCAGSDQNTRYLDTIANGGKGAWIGGPPRTFGSRFYGSAAMFDGRILMAGGGNPPTNSAELINLGDVAPVWQATASMQYARRHMNLTILADGKLLATGGSSAKGNDAAGAVLPAELWNPASESWSTMASMTVKRLYHSTALLLPDGRVLSAGGGRPAASHGGGDNANAEIYSPPYLFKETRPVITSAPTSVPYGATFTVVTPPENPTIDVVRLIRLPSVTHCNNMNQRSLKLKFKAQLGQLTVTAPLDSERNLAPPGHYMLFILSGGIPSVAKIVQIGAAAV